MSIPVPRETAARWLRGQEGSLPPSATPFSVLRTEYDASHPGLLSPQSAGQCRRQIAAVTHGYFREVKPRRHRLQLVSQRGGHAGRRRIRFDERADDLEGFAGTVSL